jgi:3-deoxy-7-phosphoheptulonate synthase
MSQTDDVRIQGLRSLIPPAVLMEELPLAEAGSELVARARREIADLLFGRDDRLAVVVGPCSVHDPEAALDYARRLAAAAERYRDDLLVVMRVYFEKPRTTVGWKGLINDPHLDDTFDINEGLHRARRFLLDVIALGLPAGSEFLDPISPQFTADLVAWGAIGARTSESQVHRELASGLSMPVGFKNGTNGTVQLAIDAIHSAANAHHFLSVTKQGNAAIVSTRGNRDCHVILRGGTTGPNYAAEHVARVTGDLERAGLAPRLMVDCSHANSDKDHRKQEIVWLDVLRQRAEKTPHLIGMMLESNLEDGQQKLGSDPSQLKYGVSITDACLGWTKTEELLEAAYAATPAVEPAAATT